MPRFGGRPAPTATVIDSYQANAAPPTPAPAHAPDARPLTESLSLVARMRACPSGGPVGLRLRRQPMPRRQGDRRAGQPLRLPRVPAIRSVLTIRGQPRRPGPQPRCRRETFTLGIARDAGQTAETRSAIVTTGLDQESRSRHVMGSVPTPPGTVGRLDKRCAKPASLRIQTLVCFASSPIRVRRFTVLRSLLSCTCGLLIALPGSVAAAPPNDPVGTWKLSCVPPDGKPRDCIVTVFRKGQVLQGTYRARGVTRPVESIKFENGELRARVSGAFGGKSY